MQIGGFTFGLVHGHQVIPWGDIESLAAVQNELVSDILVHGQTHADRVMMRDGRYFISPGSMTGAFSAMGGEVAPSFVLLSVAGKNAEAYCYRLEAGSVKVSKCTISKAAE